MPTPLTLIGGGVSNYTNGSGARTHDLYSSHLRPFHCSGTGGGDCWLWRLPSFGGGASGMHASGCGSERPFFFICSPGLFGLGERNTGVSPFSAAARLVCMSRNRGQASGAFVVFSPTVSFSRAW